MNVEGAKRYGNPTAVTWARPNAWGIVLIVLVFGFGVAGGVGLLLEEIPTGSPQLIGSELGIASGVVIIVAAGLAWWMYGRALSRTARMVRRQYPTSLVVGARIPDLEETVRLQTWPKPWGPPVGPMKLVLLVDESSVVLVNPTVPITSFLTLSWKQIEGISTCEYVEGRLAYQGMAIESSTDRGAIVLQVITPSLFPRFPQGKTLTAVVGQVSDRRRATT